MMVQTENTTNVSRLVSCLVGQVTFFISRPTSAKKPLNPRLDLGVGMLDGPFEVVGVLDIDVLIRLNHWGDGTNIPPPNPIPRPLGFAKLLHQCLEYACL